MNIGAVCNRKVITVQKEATVQHVASLMRQYHVGDVVVIETHKNHTSPIGIVTDRDLVVEVVATGLDCSVITVGDIMQKNLTVIQEDASVFETMKLMSGKGVRRLPVVDEHTYLKGIVTLDDLLILLSKEINSISPLVTREQKNETSKRR